MPDVSLLAGLAQNTTVAGVTTAVVGASSVPQNVFRDAMDSLKTANWDISNRAASDLLYAGGSTASAGWVSICKSATVADTYTEFVSKQSWPLTIAAAAGLTISQRIQGQEFAFDLVGVDDNGNPITTVQPVDVPLTGGGVATGTTITYTTTVPHGLMPGDVIAISGAQDSRLNFGPIVVQQVPTALTFQVNSSLGAATYTVGSNGLVRWCPPDAFATYLSSHRFWGTSSTNADIVSKNGERMPETQTWNPVTNLTDAQIPNENGINYSGVAYSAPQRSRYEFNIRLHQKFSNYFIKAINSVNASSSTVHRTENTPDASRRYKIRFRGRNLPNHSVPVGYITNAAKSGTTTATLTIPGHGLTTSDFIGVYGIRDQTNFANVGSVQVSSVVDANTITVVLGTAATATSYGGMAIRIQGSAALPGMSSGSVQSFAKTTDGQRLVLANSVTAATPVNGEIWTLYGLVDSTHVAQTALYGRYRVESVGATSPFNVELTPMEGQDISAVGTSSTTAGGILIRNTEFRIHFIRIENEQNSVVEIAGGQGDNDQGLAVPVTIAANSLISLSQVAGTNVSSQLTQAAQRALGVAIPAVIANTDRTSGAATTSSNTGTVADDYGNAISAQVSVTTVTGTTPRMDIALQESFDNGTTWQDIYHVQRITGSGNYLVPYQLIGGRRRWAWTLNGTSPSFTFAIVANRGNLGPSGILRNFFDYTSAANGSINVNTLNSTTQSWFVEGCKEYTLSISVGAITTTAPTLQFQTSPDNANWFNVGAPIVTTASTNMLQTYSNTPMRYARVVVTAAGTGATVNYINLVGR